MKNPLQSTLFVTGGTGFIGELLVEQWLKRSSTHRVIVQTRSPGKYESTDRLRYVRSLSECSGLGTLAVVNLAGAPIADARWTRKRKAVLQKSRIQLTEELVQNFSDFDVSVLVNASAIGFYGVGNALADEHAPQGEGFAADLCARWEAAAQEASSFSRVVVLRLGVVLGSGGALTKLIPAYRMGLGGAIGSGQQWFPWVHVFDVVSAILEALDNKRWDGAYNLVSPGIVRQAVFAKALADALHRPSFIVTPSWVLRFIFGQMADELLIGGQKVVSTRLADQHFDFDYPALEPALQAVLQLSRD